MTNKQLQQHFIKYLGFKSLKEFRAYVKLVEETPGPLDDILKRMKEREMKWYSNPVQLKFTKEEK